MMNVHNYPVRSRSQYLFILLLVPLTTITVGCNAGNLNVSSTSLPPTELLASTSQSIPTWDSSTPAPPSGAWATYTYPNSGLSFNYPANWFISFDKEQNLVAILNAPPGGIRAVKGGEGGDPEFVKIIVYLKPTNIPLFQTFESYVKETIKQPNWAAEIISVETIPALQQGYSAVRVVSSGLGEWTHYFVANGRHLTHVTSDYLPERQAELASIVYEVVNTLIFR